MKIHAGFYCQIMYINNAPKFTTVIPQDSSSCLYSDYPKDSNSVIEMDEDINRFVISKSLHCHCESKVIYFKKAENLGLFFN